MVVFILAQLLQGHLVHIEHMLQYEGLDSCKHTAWASFLLIDSIDYAFIKIEALLPAF